MLNSTILLVSGDNISLVGGESFSIVGQKAIGLNLLAENWTKPFFVISGNMLPEQFSVDSALKRKGMLECEKVIVRSSGVDESLHDRGAFFSEVCKKSEIIKVINELSEKINFDSTYLIHWIIQEYIPEEIKGHLSNEKRISKDARDWMVEFEASDASKNEIYNISIRPWRDSSKSEISNLICEYKESITERLKDVAKWATENKKRIHFEWVWNGEAIFIVQADNADIEKQGVNPKNLIPKSFASKGKDLNSNLKLFRSSGEKDFICYRKLKNAKIYKSIGYEGYVFCILDKQDIFKKLFSTEKIIDNDLLSDFTFLMSNPLILRTDGKGIPEDKLRMLPRSDELRTLDSAKKWLVDVFRKTILELNLEGYDLCLIAHHFIPAVSSAWCQVDPKARVARIESLWGVPEGLYWYSHDIFDVDTGKLGSDAGITPDKTTKVMHSRPFFKDNFIAPDESGKWVIQKTDDQHCWSSSIAKGQWVKEIAWNSRRIAKEVNEKVVVMWLIDIPGGISKYSVLPWYHEVDKSNSQEVPEIDSKYNLLTRDKWLINTESDWEKVKMECISGTKIGYIRMKPEQPELVRNQDFASELAKFSKEYKFMILLSGGMLSHAYYMLKQKGAHIVCENFYGNKVDQLEFNKLVRDKIPEKILSHGESVKTIKLEGEALELSIKKKIIEEAFEVQAAETQEDITEELADMIEIITAYCALLNIDTNYFDRIFKGSPADKKDISLLCSEIETRVNINLSFPVFLKDNLIIERKVCFHSNLGLKVIFYLKFSIYTEGDFVKVRLEISQKPFSLLKERKNKKTLVDSLKEDIIIKSYKVLDECDISNQKINIDNIYASMQELASNLKIEKKIIKEIKLKKVNKAGAFHCGVMLLKTELTSIETDENAQYFNLDSDVVSNLKYLPTIKNIVSTDERKFDENEIYLFDFKLSSYQKEIINDRKEYRVTNGVGIRFNIRRELANVICSFTIEDRLEESSIIQLSLFNN